MLQKRNVLQKYLPLLPPTVITITHAAHYPLQICLRNCHTIYTRHFYRSLCEQKKQPLYACPGLRGHLPTGFGQMRNWHQNFLSFKKSSTLCSFFSSKETFLSILAIIFSCFPYNFHEYIAHKRIFYLYLHCLNNLRSRQRGEEELGKTIHLWKASPDVVKLTS